MAKKRKSKKRKSSARKKTTTRKSKSRVKTLAKREHNLEKRVSKLEKDNAHNKSLWGHLINYGRVRNGDKPVKNAFDMPVNKALPWTKQLPG